MDMTDHFPAIRLSQESDHRNDDQQCLQSFAQQDRECPMKVDAVLAASGSTSSASLNNIRMATRS